MIDLCCSLVFNIYIYVPATVQSAFTSMLNCSLLSLNVVFLIVKITAVVTMLCLKYPAPKFPLLHFLGPALTWKTWKSPVICVLPAVCCCNCDGREINITRVLLHKVDMPKMDCQ